MIIYTVKTGDSLYKLATRYGITTNDIVFANQLSNPDKIAIGQALIIPVDSFEYIVKKGDSLYLIAKKYNTSINKILELNPEITNPSSIYIGQTIKIPTKSKLLRSIYSNGYTFTNIREESLETALPNLSFLSPFSYQIREDGSLSKLNDTNLIEKAQKENTKSFMVITNIGEKGGFSSDLANEVLNNEKSQNDLIKNIIDILNQKQYKGLNVDFEYVYPKDKNAYNNFLQKVSDKIKPLGYLLSTAVAPKIRENQQGLLYEAHDYKFHGKVADYVIPMTYEWGYTFGPPMAVAPINQVEKVLKYAVSAIPSRKILMGMPNYGYDWTLPYKPGTRARSLSNLQAMNLAINTGSVIKYDNISQAPYFNYYDEKGKKHVVWFDDARSLTARLKLIEKYNLGGISYWTINRLYRALWYTLEDLYNVNK